MEKNYCEIQENCKLLIQANAQYDAVVKQNKSLQTELRFISDNNKKDNTYITELEESNMLLLQENEKYKTEIEKLKSTCTELIKRICNNCGWKDSSSCDNRCEYKQAIEYLDNEYEVKNDK